MKSSFLKLNWKDFIKGLILAFITALITGFYELLQEGAFAFDWVTLKPVLMVSIAAALSYLIKNLLTNSEDKLLTAEK